MATKQQIKYEMFQDALNAAHVAASKAQEGMKEDMNALDCGFAWVVVDRRDFMTWCRTQKERCEAEMKKLQPGTPGYAAWAASARSYGDKHYAAGWCFWCPGSFAGQAVGIHEAGSRAFRDSLAQTLNLSATVGSRLD